MCVGDRNMYREQTGKQKMKHYSTDLENVATVNRVGKNSGPGDQGPGTHGSNSSWSFLHFTVFYTCTRYLCKQSCMANPLFFSLAASRTMFTPIRNYKRL